MVKVFGCRQAYEAAAVPRFRRYRLAAASQQIGKAEGYDELYAPARHPSASTQTCTIADQVYRCGERATQALADLVRGQALRCDPLGLDRYRRTIGRCKIESTGQDIESWMVRQGYAVAYTRYSYAYVHDELIARI